MVARDLLDQKVVRVPSCDDLDVAKQLKVEYVNEADSEKSKVIVVIWCSEFVFSVLMGQRCPMNHFVLHCFGQRMMTRISCSLSIVETVLKVLL